jgi:hypothetical protein
MTSFIGAHDCFVWGAKRVSKCLLAPHFNYFFHGRRRRSFLVQILCSHNLEQCSLDLLAMLPDFFFLMPSTVIMLKSSSGRYLS